jgi:arylsulfatase A-like enzyme
MTHYRNLIAALVVLAGFFPHETIAAAEAGEKPNFIFIAVDDLNDWVGFLGGHPQARTPHLDALASQATVFENAQTVSPGCSPSRNAILYGIEPYNSGLYAFYGHAIHLSLQSRYISLPRLLKENGYKTFGAGKIHHGPEYSELEWSDYFSATKKPKVFAASKGFAIASDWKFGFRPVTNPLTDLRDHQVTSYGVKIIESNYDEPYFLAVGFTKPHLPLECPRRFYEPLSGSIAPPNILESDLDDIGPEANSMRRAKDDRRFREKLQWEEVRRNYLACVSWIDYNIGRLLDALSSQSATRRTIVVLWSDHGFHLGEKMTFRKFTLWEESTRVPFLVSDSRTASAAGNRVASPVTLINIYRTIAEFAGVEVPEYVDGFSLVPHMENPDLKTPSPAITTWGRGNYSVRTANWRYIQYFDGDKELYNHSVDPNEWHNLANLSEHRERVASMASKLPSVEANTIEEHIQPWSLFGADARKIKTSPEL